MAPAERPLPASVEAEQALLGAVLVNNLAFDGASKVISADDFSEEVHRRTWTAIEGLIADGRAATLINLKASLGDLPLGEGVTIGQYLARLAAGATTIINAVDYAKTIRSMAERRKIIAFASDTLEMAYSAPIEMRPSQIAASAIDMLDGVVARGSTGAPRITIGQATEDTIAKAYATLQGDVKPSLRTGLIGIDRRLNGLEGGDLIILAGRPGMGKSALAVQIALNIALRKDPDGVGRDGVAFISLEMTSGQIAQRAISNRCQDRGVKVEYRDIREALGLKDYQLEAMEDARRALSRAPLIIEQEGGLSLAQISARARRIKGMFEAKGKSLKLLIVDHMGIIKPGARNPNREREVAEISAGMKTLAKDLEIPVLALCQLSRRVEERKIEERRPLLSDLRESGSIEQDADVVLFAFREAYYLNESRSLTAEQQARIYQVENDLEVIAGKVRQGATGVAKFWCDMATNTIRDPAQQEIEGLAA